MQFMNEMTLPLAADDVFAALVDVERVAGCLPGARVEAVDGNGYRGAMRVKVGPILADYHGTLFLEQLDPARRQAILRASGNDAAGQGSAEARIVSSVFEAVGGSRVVVETDLRVHGRVAQFGSGPMEKIASHLFRDFALNLERLLSPEQRPDGDHAATFEGSSVQADTQERKVTDGSVASDDSFDVVRLVNEAIVEWLRKAGLP